MPEPSAAPSAPLPPPRRKLSWNRRETRTGIDGGVGGIRTMRTGKLAWFELGGHRFTDPNVSFATFNSAAFADEYTLGTVGQEFLKPFKVVFWYQGEKIAFVKR